MSTVYLCNEKVAYVRVVNQRVDIRQTTQLDNLIL